MLNSKIKKAKKEVSLGACIFETPRPACVDRLNVVYKKTFAHISRVIGLIRDIFYFSYFIKNFILFKNYLLFLGTTRIWRHMKNGR